MRTQAEDLAAGKHVQSTDDLENVERELEAGGTEGPAKAAPEKKFGYVAVCAGAGLEAVFRDLGVDGPSRWRTDHEPLHRGHSEGDRAHTG